jgi:hypothetical protein
MIPPCEADWGPGAWLLGPPAQGHCSYELALNGGSTDRVARREAQLPRLDLWSYRNGRIAMYSTR